MERKERERNNTLYMYVREGKIREKGGEREREMEGGRGM